MTETAKKSSLSREQLRNLLAGVRDNGPVDETDVETVDYDWKRPHQYNESHRRVLSQFSTLLSTGLTDEFCSSCNDPSRVSISAVKEYYCSAIKEEFNKDKSNYYMVIIDDNSREVGVIVISHLSAVQWASKMLGDTMPEVTEEYVMSNLEESLLGDLLNGIVSRLSDALLKHELKGVRSQEILTNREWPVECLDYDEFSLFKFDVEHTEGSGEASMLILSSMLGPMLGINFADESHANDNQVKEAVIENINKIPIEVNVLLGNATIAMSNLMNLSKGDVVVLDRKAHEPVEVLIEGKVFFHGVPAKTMHRYAIVVTDMVTPGEELISI